MPRLSLVEKHKSEITQDPRHPAHDPIRAGVRLTYDFEVYPYGVPVRFRTNSESVAAAARQTWSGWLRRFDVSCVEVRCLVDLDSDPDESCPEPPLIRAQGHLLTMTAGVNNFACCDLSRGFAFGWITRRVAANHDYLRFFFLDGMVGPILSAKYLVFIHAACIASDGEAVLLAGDSGAGKTSLSYACARSGWTFLSDDASAIFGEGGRQVVLGDSRRFRFRDSAAALFPELKGLSEPQRQWQGKPTLEYPTCHLDIQTASEARPARVVFLKRHRDPGGKTALTTLRDMDAAVARLRNDVWPRELGMFERDTCVLRNLLKVPTYELHYCRLEDGVDLLGCFLSRECA